MKLNVDALNEDIKQFPQVFPITEDMRLTHKGVSRLVMLDRYAFKDTEKKTLKEGDFVVLTIKSDPNFPARGTGFIRTIDWEKEEAQIQIEPEFLSVLDSDEAETGMIKRSINVIDKPLEVYYEQIAKRNANGLSKVEKNHDEQQYWFEKFE